MVTKGDKIMATKLHDYAHAENWYQQFTIEQLVDKRTDFKLDLADDRKALSVLAKAMISNNISFITDIIASKRKVLR